ncbi:probable c-type cytochrome [Pseudooceanicola batsensis HTCC2597]|uniref:Probable c-type cytochrome n=1 Tax=Pseudooceanicola batsensis (strain ATCC BAA-863 / DSM 15984 / KCTC 12145 / HTCC2597) TaxID=252305 RepID=A3TSH6_PSEBH|nr:cytochrome c [Pseudooceanicola batsensis]EAQ04603.1 probable c-type cytochrome [Pseudooceanicola batsensis HTCC2597]
MRRGLTLGLVSGLAGAAAIAAVAQGLLEEEAKAPEQSQEIAGLSVLGEPVTRDMVEQGGEIYAESCAACHGAKLEGQPDWRRRTEDGRMPAPPHDDSGHTWHHADRDLFTITKHGVGAVVPGYESDMPAFEGLLSDDEIKAVLAYIKTSWSKRERAFQAEVSAGAEGKP